MKLSIMDVIFVCLVLTSRAQAFYNPSSGRWLSRDPSVLPPTVLQPSSAHSPNRGAIDDQVLYVMVRNNAVKGVDVLGLVKWSPHGKVGEITIATRLTGVGVQADVLQGTTDKGRTIQFWKAQNTSDYWCHGYTFDGSEAPGGPYSPFGYHPSWGDSVSRILEDDGWSHVCCGSAKAGDIAVFYREDKIVHSGKILTIANASTGFNEFGSYLMAKDDSYGPLGRFTFAMEARSYSASYKCFSKQAPAGGGSAQSDCCPKPGDNEMAPVQ